MCNYLGCSRDWRIIHIPNCSSCVLSASTYTSLPSMKSVQWEGVESTVWYEKQALWCKGQAGRPKLKWLDCKCCEIDWCRGEFHQCMIFVNTYHLLVESLCSICVMVVDTVTVLSDSSVDILGYRGTVSYSIIKLHVPQQTSFVYRNCDSNLKMAI